MSNSMFEGSVAVLSSIQRHDDDAVETDICEGAKVSTNNVSKHSLVFESTSRCESPTSTSSIHSEDPPSASLNTLDDEIHDLDHDIRRSSAARRNAFHTDELRRQLKRHSIVHTAGLNSLSSDLSDESGRQWMVQLHHLSQQAQEEEEQGDEESTNDVALDMPFPLRKLALPGRPIPKNELPLDRFRRYVHQCVCLRRNTNALKQAPITSDDQIITQMQYQSENGQTRYTILFNLNAFITQCQLEMRADAKRVLMKPPQQRDPWELKQLLSIVTRLKCFEKYSRDLQMDLCKIMRYTSLEVGRTIIRQGHPGTAFYFVLSGCVYVNIDSKDPESGDVYQKNIDTLRKGDSFGELALLQDIERTATVVCKERTELLVVDKEDFQLVLVRSVTSDMENKMEFLRKVALFSSWSNENLRNISGMCKLRAFKKHQLVLKTEMDTDMIYFVRSGTIKCLRSVTVNAQGGIKGKAFLHVCCFQEFEYFGTESMLDSPDRNASHVSYVFDGRSECYLIGKSNFLAFATAKSLAILRSLRRVYHSEKTLQRLYREQTQWIAYKSELIESITRCRRVPAPRAVLPPLAHKTVDSVSIIRNKRKKKGNVARAPHHLKALNIHQRLSNDYIKITSKKHKEEENQSSTVRFSQEIEQTGTLK